MDLFEDIDGPLLPFTLPDDDGYLVQWDKTLNGFNISIPNGELFYAEHFFDKKISDRSLEYFLKNDSNEWMKMDWRNISGKELDSIKFNNINNIIVVIKYFANYKLNLSATLKMKTINYS